jgi:hypothetical protein
LFLKNKSKVTKGEIFSSAGQIEVHRAMITIECLDAKSGEIFYKSVAETYVSKELDSDKMKKDFHENTDELLIVFPSAVKE